MDLKPTNVVVSLVSLLGIVLPGSIIAFLGLTGAWRPWLPFAVTGVPEGSPEGWAIFIIASYAAGQALYAFGSWFLDPVYNRTYRSYKERIRGNPKRFVWPLIQAQFPHVREPSNYSWARAYVVSRSPGAIVELDQLEADFKFFRSLALVLLVAPFEAVPVKNGLLEASTIIGVALVVLGAVWNVFTNWRNPDYRYNPTEPGQHLDAPIVILVLGLLIVLGAGITTIIGAVGWIVAVAHVLAFVVVLLRFFQQRWQRNETTYEYAAVIAAQTNSTTAGASSGAISAHASAD